MDAFGGLTYATDRPKEQRRPLKMLFNSLEFIFIFLPAAVFLHFLAARRSSVAAVAMTTFTSMVFYAWWKPQFVLLPLLSIVLNYWLANKIIKSDQKAARLLVFAGIAANLAVLGYFKYADFVVSIIEQRSPESPNVPLALSFTTFVQIAFLVEASRKPAEIPLARYAMFVSFFPHLIAGPIVRWSELGPQLADKLRYRIQWDNIALGLTIFCLGLTKKVLLADTLANHVAPVFDASAAGVPMSAVAAWGASVAYSLQLYFDFSGYSDMAVGLGLLFNLRLPLNFAAPFRATSIIDLWRRWHITLSRFLRDFVYVPLGGSERGQFRRAVNLFATMVIGGLWHGANWTFIAWGAFHGILLTVNHLWRTWRGVRRQTLLGRFAGWALTFTAFVIGMTFFRSPDIETAGRLIQAMAGFGHAPYDGPFMVDFDFWTMEKGVVTEAFIRRWFGLHWTLVGTATTLGVLAVALALPDTMEFVNYREGEPHSAWRKSWGPLVWSPSLTWAAASIALFMVVFANLNSFSEFLYYQF
jgi:alginate O-acetyltransferase complex protein AlgI